MQLGIPHNNEVTANLATYKLIGVYLAKVLKRASRHISIDAAIFKFDSVFCYLRLQLSTATIATGKLQTANCELRTATLRTATLRATWATGQRGNYDSRPFEPKHAFQRGCRFGLGTVRIKVPRRCSASCRSGCALATRFGCVCVWRSVGVCGGV